ncbi:predicted protein, partial [Nematostella vectensis]
QVAKFLDTSGGKLNYRLYGEFLFDVLFAGGILAPGGSIVEDGPNPSTYKTNICIFEANNDNETLRKHVQMHNKLICRYRYLQKSYEEEMNKILLFLKGFTDEEREKLAFTTGVVLANG